MAVLVSEASRPLASIDWKGKMPDADELDRSYEREIELRVEFLGGAREISEATSAV
jgi:hypothetical protein